MRSEVLFRYMILRLKMWNDMDVIVKSSPSIEIEFKHNVIKVVTKEGVVNLVEVTYSSLVSLRNSSQLVPGQFYRITDYVTTTSQEGTDTAGHRFDIILLALSPSKLSEQVWLDYNAEDDYFKSNSVKLNAYKVWYCVDNHTSRWAWADKTNGKGVIYRMIDDRGNDCPYDFKNILFYDDSSKQFVYTFNCLSGESGDNNIYDASVFTKNVRNNVIGENFSDELADNGKYALPFVIFKPYVYSRIHWYNNRIGHNCRNITFDYDNAHDNTISESCDNISFYDGAAFNTIGKDCSDVSLYRARVRVGDTVKHTIVWLSVNQDDGGFMLRVESTRTGEVKKFYLADMYEALSQITIKVEE